MKKLLYAFICFLYIIGPVLNTPLNLYGDPILFLSAIFSCYLFVGKFDTALNPRIFLGLFEYPFIGFQFYLILPLLGAFFFPVYGGLVSLADFIRPLRIVLTMYAGLALVLIAYKLYYMAFFIKLIKIITYVMIINAAIICCQTMFESVRDVINSFLFRIDDGVDRYGIELRSSGLYLSGGALPSVFQTIVTIFIPYLISRKEFNYWLGLLFSLFLFITSIFTGRSGIFVSIPFVYTAFIFLSKRQFYNMLVFFMLGLFFLLSYVSFFESEAFAYAIERFSWLANESKDSGTIAIILNKLSIPDNVFILLFGVLNFNNAIYSHVSDMGFNIKLWTYGFVGWIFFYLSYFKMMFYVCRFKFDAFKDERILVIIFLLTYLFFEFKENMMYARNGMSILSLVMYAYVVYRYKIRMLVRMTR